MDKTRKPYPLKARERIQAGMILDRLEKHILGEVELSNTQINAARILLSKVLPDLKAVEHSGEISSKPVRAMTNDELSAELARYRALLPTADGREEAAAGADECGSVH